MQITFHKKDVLIFSAAKNDLTVLPPDIIGLRTAEMIFVPTKAEFRLYRPAHGKTFRVPFRAAAPRCGIARASENLTGITVRACHVNGRKKILTADLKRLKKTPREKCVK